MMTENQLARMLNGLQSAMRAEFEGYHFYMLASENTDDEKGKNALRTMAADEFEHMNFLQTQYDALVKTQQPDAAFILRRLDPSALSQRIFSEEIKSRIKDAHYEMTILSVGVQLELTAMNTYKNLSATAENVVMARFYEDLANWETSHYQALVAQQDALKEAYWAANHFQPY